MSENLTVCPSTRRTRQFMAEIDEWLRGTEESEKEALGKACFEHDLENMRELLRHDWGTYCCDEMMQEVLRIPVRDRITRKPRQSKVSIEKGGWAEQWYFRTNRGDVPFAYCPWCGQSLALRNLSFSRDRIINSLPGGLQKYFRPVPEGVAEGQGA